MTRHAFIAAAILLGTMPARAGVAPIDVTDDGGGGSDTEWTDDDDAPADGAKAGDVLYHVYWEGHGVFTYTADYYFMKYRDKVVADCAAAGGVLKNEKWDTSGIGWYKNEGWADCVKT